MWPLGQEAWLDTAQGSGWGGIISASWVAEIHPQEPLGSKNRKTLSSAHPAGSLELFSYILTKKAVIFSPYQKTICFRKQPASKRLKIRLPSSPLHWPVFLHEQEAAQGISSLCYWRPSVSCIIFTDQTPLRYNWGQRTTVQTHCFPSYLEHFLLAPPATSGTCGAADLPQASNNKQGSPCKRTPTDRLLAQSTVPVRKFVCACC